MLVKRSHAIPLGYCSKGIRYWCEQHGLSYLEFVKQGIDESVIASFGDTMANNLIAAAKESEKEGA